MTHEVDDTEDARNALEFARVNEKLKAMYARDTERVASGELDAQALSWFSKDFTQRVTHTWPAIDFDEFARDYDL